MEEQIWKAIIKNTGYVGVICFVLYQVVDRIFQKEIYDLIGGEKVFILTLIILGVITVALISAIRSSAAKSNPNPTGSNTSPVVNYKDSSTHNGDNRF